MELSSRKFLDDILHKATDARINSGTSKESIKRKLGNEQVWIYGAGNTGRKVYNYLRSCGLEIVGFLDIKAIDGDKLFDKYVIHPKSPKVSQQCKNNDLIIICIIGLHKSELESIKADLLEWGYKRVDFCYDIQLPFESLIIRYRDDETIEQIIKNYNAVEKAFNLLADAKSKQIFTKYIQAYASKNYNEFEDADSEIHYFPNDVQLYKGTERFIDCGAYDGDTIRSMVKSRGKADSIIAFEPTKRSFAKLCDYVKQSNGSCANTVTLFPCGVWNKTEMIAFNDNGVENAISNSISEIGNEYIQCVSIDEVLIGFRPKLIKMDIEGAEHNALLGAKQTICENKSDLAICIYHALADIWRIPLLIDSWGISYNYHIRAHGFFGYDTVLYVTSAD